MKTLTLSFLVILGLAYNAVDGIMSDPKVYCGEVFGDPPPYAVQKQGDTCKVLCMYPTGTKELLAQDGIDCGVGKDTGTDACLNYVCKKLVPDADDKCKLISGEDKSLYKPFAVDNNPCKELCVPKDGSPSFSIPLDNSKSCIFTGNKPGKCTYGECKLDNTVKAVFGPGLTTLAPRTAK